MGKIKSITLSESEWTLLGRSVAGIAQTIANNNRSSLDPDTGTFLRDNPEPRSALQHAGDFALLSVLETLSKIADKLDDDDIDCSTIELTLTHWEAATVIQLTFNLKLYDADRTTRTTLTDKLARF